jgi:hypothetical protein
MIKINSAGTIVATCDSDPRDSIMVAEDRPSMAGRSRDDEVRICIRRPTGPIGQLDDREATILMTSEHAVMFFRQALALAERAQSRVATDHPFAKKGSPT